MYKPGKPVHPSNGVGTAPDAAATPAGIEVSFDGGPNRNRQATSAVLVTNLEVARNLEISFDEGRDWFSIAFGATVCFPIIIHRVRLRGRSGGTAGYSILGIIS